MRLRSLAIFGLGVLLSGCVTAEEQRAADEAQCRSYGFRHNNDAFATCLQRLDLERRAAFRDAQDFDSLMGPPVIYRPIIVRPRHHHKR
ncbi:hypothetical protein [Manganibacter manganicus]|uniref:Lipoprotein n=1 Tax=Manganibacter manganicus TaxID=1873176 RepID=A0A1V8RKH7_9HYPH|nr:hypothetical protein [Pseudaminobacter manganicus]OQM73708.1 hypothetical protein BFN67_07260 [Pseudaminobacter manganicus]